MKKIAFALYVLALIIMLPLCMILELSNTRGTTWENENPAGVMRKAKEPKAIVKVEIQNNGRAAINSFPFKAITPKF